MSPTRILQVCLVCCLMLQQILATPPNEGVVHKEDLEALANQIRLLGNRVTRTEGKLADTEKELRQSEDKQRYTEIQFAETDRKLKLTESMLTHAILRNSVSISKLENKSASQNSARSTINSKVCYWYNPSKFEDQGPLLSCQGEKLRGDTVMRISFSGSLRVFGVAGQPRCRRWWFTVNSVECSTKIDTELYTISLASNTNNYRPAYIAGYCQNVAVGPVNVTWNVGPCLILYPGVPGDAVTGQGSAVYITIEEVDGTQIQG